MAARAQFPFRQVVPGLDVVGWGAHRYEPAVGLSPAHVDLNLDTGEGVVSRLTVSLGLREALLVATAILEAAKQAERAAPGMQGDESDPAVSS